MADGLRALQPLWTEDGTRDRLLGALHARLDAAGQIDWDLFAIGGTSVRASRSAAGAGGENRDRHRAA